MIILTDEQRAFLDHQEIPLGKVFDASGLRPKEFKVIMKDLDKLLAVGVTPCRDHGHTMRLRSNHCAQCNTHAFAFRARYEEDGWIYVAGSTNGGVVKVGFTNEIKKRKETLNSTGYGGLNDWEILYQFKTNDAGRVEFQLQRALIDYISPKTYIKQGREVECLEIFSCSYGIVKNLIDELFVGSELLDVFESENIADYDFKNVKFTDQMSQAYKRKGGHTSGLKDGISISKSIKEQEFTGIEVNKKKLLIAILLALTSIAVLWWLI